MEERKVLVENIKKPKETSSQEKKNIYMKCEGDKVYIGEMPQLVVNIKTQENYIVYQGGTMPYYREIGLSKDLLEGKRTNVLCTALEHYYAQACQVARGKEVAELYRKNKIQ